MSASTLQAPLTTTLDGGEDNVSKENPQMIFHKDVPNIGNENNQGYFDEDDEDKADVEGGDGGAQPYMSVSNADECLQEVARVIYQDEDTRRRKLHEYITSYIACLEKLIQAEDYDQLVANEWGFELVSAIQD